MAKEKIIKGKRCRQYYAYGVWISDDATVVEQEFTRKLGFSYFPSTRPLTPRTDSNGEKYVSIRGKGLLYLSHAVMACFGTPAPADGENYELVHLNGDRSDNRRSNLKWELSPYVHATTDSVDIDYRGFTLTVGMDGTVRQDGKQLSVCDSLYDGDTGCHSWIAPHVSVSRPDSIYPERVNIDDLMRAAGYVQGDNRHLSRPVILHKDNDPGNFHKDNLVWSEADDAAYVNYRSAIERERHRRNLELNPGKSLPPGW